MKLIIPIMDKLHGYAFQGEQIKSFDTSPEDPDEIVAIYFACGEFRKVSGGWVLSCNGSPMAIFPDAPTAPTVPLRD